MIKLLKYIFMFIFLVSALLKTIDFQNTAFHFSALFSLNYKSSKLLLTALICIEFLIAWAVFYNLQYRKILLSGIVLLLLFFMILNIRFLFQGIQNCGCMGTFIETYPLISLVKNSLLLAMIFTISRKHVSQ